VNENEFTSVFMGHFFTDGTNALDVRPDVAQALDMYFGPPGKRYSGSQFEDLILDSDPFCLSAQDLIAVTTLSVSIPARAAIWILSEDGRNKISSILKEIPMGRDIWDPDVRDIFLDDGPVMELWRTLGNANWPVFKPGGGLGGSTKRSKILASKRPRLIPILDRVVRGSLPETKNTWISIQRVLRNDFYRTRLEKALENQNVSENVSLLRRIDAVIWINNEKKFRRG
jgi:hypothetical protein